MFHARYANHFDNHFGNHPSSNRKTQIRDLGARYSLEPLLIAKMSPFS